MKFKREEFTAQEKQALDMRLNRFSDEETAIALDISVDDVIYLRQCVVKKVNMKLARQRKLK